jgi:hypothetical protein
MLNEKTLSMDEIVTAPKVSRRGTMRAIGACVTLGAAAIVLGGGSAAAQQAEPLCTDRDPSDPPNRARCRGVTDGDPSDPGGCGRRSCSDSDPSDPAGGGCHC